jgi:tetratricopeptide (TPR) repeat protein
MKQSFALIALALLLSVAAGRADGTDDQYVLIYNSIQEADLLSSSAQFNQALTKYLEAQKALQRFQRLNPGWNEKVVSFRLSYLESKIAAIPSAVAATAPPTASTRPSTNHASLVVAKPAAAELDNQVNVLHAQLRQLQADKILLEAKLKEALSVQPATLDPREMARSQEKVKSLLKENDLLKVNLEQVKSRSADTKALKQTQAALVEANEKLAAESERAKALQSEKIILQNKLSGVKPDTRSAAALDSTRRALEEANRQLAQQKELATRLASEKADLQSRIKTSTVDSAATVALRVENQILKKELADWRAAPSARPGDNSRQLSQAQAQIASLQSDREILRLEKIALETRVKQLAAGSPKGTDPVVASSVLPAQSRPEDQSRIRQLERERDELQKKLETANRELYGRNGSTMANRVLDMENQMAVLRARLEVFEARSVPYTTEELAMFKTPEPKLAADPHAGKKSIREMPSGSATLVADAQRYFANRQFDRAEEKYQQILQKDQKNVPTLANLAAIELENNHLDEAEKHIKQATALAPEDAYSYSVLGQLRFRQGKYDDALDALSRAAKVEPDNPRIQNLLGLTLSEKGMRGPAETALRKAIQLEPGYGDAHANLAVIYATQHPPLLELARWHYQKSLSAGNPRNSFLERTLTSPKTADNR